MQDDPEGFTPTPFPQVLSQAEAQLNKLDLPKNGRKKGRRGPRQPKVKHDPTIRTRGGTPTRGRKTPSPNKKLLEQVTRRHLGIGKAQTASVVPINLTLALQACQGLTADEIKFVADVAQALQAWPEESRTRVAFALGRMFP